MPDDYEKMDTLSLWLGDPEDTATLDLSGCVSNVATKNELSYSAEPTRYNDMTLHNDQEAYYVPTVEFTLNYILRSELFTLLQLINSKGFVVEYFDQELGELVYRSMYATEQSINELLHSGATLEGGNGVKVKFVSRYGYPYTPRSNASVCVEANKYHMAQLHLHKSPSDFLPSGHSLSTEEAYV